MQMSILLVEAGTHNTMEGPEEPWNKWVKVPESEMNEGWSECLGQFNTDQDLPWNFLWCYLDTSAFPFIPAFALLLSYICHPTTQYQSGVKLHQPYTQCGVHQAMVAGLSSVVFPVGDTCTAPYSTGSQSDKWWAETQPFSKAGLFVCLFENQMIKETMSDQARVYWVPTGCWLSLLK